MAFMCKQQWVIAVVLIMVVQVHCQDPAWDNTRTDQEESSEIFADVSLDSLPSTTGYGFNREDGRLHPPAYEEANFKESDTSANYMYDAIEPARYSTDVELEVDTLEPRSSSDRGDGDAGDDGYDMVEEVDDTSNNGTGVLLSTTSVGSRYLGGSCATGNPADDCWRCDPNWAAHRQSLASCAIGFGRNAIGGKNGKIYVVTSPRDDDPANPTRGTLRYAVTRPGPLWIIFARSMNIYLKNELIITSFKTIDGRGVNVQIVGGAGLTLQYVNNIIVHGISIHDIHPTGPARIMSSTYHVGDRGKADGDAISVYTSKNLWIDHCYLARAADGLIDVIKGSTLVTISNNYFTQHDKVLLLGAHPNDIVDRGMQVTVAFNTFGPGLVQRLPRVRLGSVHVVNNDYSAGWKIYAIGGSEDPTILSEGNIFHPGSGPKQVTKRINDGGSSYGGPRTWKWKSVGDIFLAGSYFTSSSVQWSTQAFAKAYSFTARPASMVMHMTTQSGPLVHCRQGSRC